MLESIHVGMTGLLGYSQGLRVIANNTTNLNTPGFKSSSLHFADLFYSGQDLSRGDSPRLGFGLNTLGTQLSFKQGDLRQTGNDMDVAIDGQGLFVLKDDAGNLSYTRAGQFQFDKEGVLTANNYKQQVMGLDDNGNLVNIRLTGQSTHAGKATTTVTFNGNLSSTVTEQVVGGVKIIDGSGGEHTLDLKFTNDSATAAGQWTVELLDGTVSHGTGTLVFVDGAPTAASARISMTYTPAGQAAQALVLDLGTDVTSYASGNLSTLAMSKQDGQLPGGLTAFTINEKGALSLSYSNGQTRTSTRLALARFETLDAVESSGDNQFVAADHRLWRLGAAGEGGFGAIQAKTVEISNVDLSQEFSDLVVMQRGYRYDRAGQITQIIDHTLDKITRYAYDLAGNRVLESTTQAGVVYQDNHMAYDALGRLCWVGDGRVSVTMEYDKVGNRTRILTHYLSQSDAAFDKDRYYQYDAMNRQTVVDAVDAAGNLGTQGRRITYDLNGNRTSEVAYGTKVSSATNFTTSQGLATETYSYDALNRLSAVERDGLTIDARVYDRANRLVQSGGSQAVGYYNALYGADTVGTGSERRTNSYDANGRTVAVRVMTSTGAAKYNLNYGNYDAAGNLLGYSLTNYQGTAYTNTYTYGLLKRDAYREATISGTSTYFTPGTTTNSYDAHSNLVAVTDSGNAANNRSFVNDEAGRVLHKTQGSTVERQLVVNGEVLAVLKNSAADFNFGYTPISASYPQANPGTYAVAANDSLKGIAKTLYGDAGLWYLIADANGLSSDRDLRVGQTLTLPNRVTGASNHAGSFKPYDPSDIVGETAPTLPSPPPPKPKKKGCGGLGQESGT